MCATLISKNASEAILNGNFQDSWSIFVFFTIYNLESSDPEFSIITMINCNSNWITTGTIKSNISSTCNVSIQSLNNGPEILLIDPFDPVNGNQESETLHHLLCPRRHN